MDHRTDQINCREKSENVSIIGPVVGPNAVTVNFLALSNALNPVGPVENFLVEEMARRAVQTKDFDVSLDTLRHEGEAAFSCVLGKSDGGGPAKLALAGVLASEKYEALMRQSIGSSRGYLKALSALRDIRAAANGTASSSHLSPDTRFATEQACLSFLVRRYIHGRCACLRCGATSGGSFVAIRTSWYCGHCQAQIGLRRGTCMERSQLPLTIWFAAIRIVLTWPTIGTEELAAALKIKRCQTVRNVKARIRAAINSDNPSHLLAGLDEVYLGIF